MKKFIALILAAAALLAFCACEGSSSRPAVSKDGYKAMLDIALKLVTDFTEEDFAKVLPPSAIEYNKEEYAKRDKDYIELVKQDYAATAASYSEAYGSDWKLSYVINSADEKDAEGIEKYKKFDDFYFRTYNVDQDRITAVTFVKVTVKVEGSKGSNTKDKTIQCFCYDGAWYSLYAVRLGLKLA